MPKLIEKNFPFERLSVIAEQESWRKEVYRPVYYLHKWWARRLGSVFRGILLASCMDENGDFWSRFYGKNSFENVIVFDPFMGSGVTIGEAMKLGCKAVGRDINPVSYLSSRAAFSRYNQPDIMRTYRQLQDILAPTLLRYFSTRTKAGEDATVLYYFLVKTTSCPDCGSYIDLFKTRIFSKNAVPQKDSSARSICPGCGSINVIRYDSERTVCPGCNVLYNPQEGNIKGPQVRCGRCLSEFRLIDRMKSVDGPLGFRRFAKMIITKDGIKEYELLNEFDRDLEQQVAAECTGVLKSFPAVAVEPGYNTNQILKHNYNFWHQLFSDRQLICIRRMIDAIRHIDDPDGRLLFACLFSGVLEFNNLFTSFKGEGTGAVRHMFAHHVLKPEMMPLEANIWGTSKSSGAFSTLFQSRVEKALSYKSDPTELRMDRGKSTMVKGISHRMEAHIAGSYAEFVARPGSVYLSSGDSSCVDMPDKSIELVVTDPPFFDNVHYSQLADFFYYWLNQTLDLSTVTTTRCSGEVQDTDSDLFTTKLTSVFAECSRVLRDDGLFVFTYHHSRHEGWTAVHRALRHSGFVCSQTYPVKAEMSVSMPLLQAKSPIHLDLILVCKKDKEHVSHRSPDADFQSAMAVATSQISSLRTAGIKISLGDAKVILMGRFLCEAHKSRNLDFEEKFLDGIQEDIDAYAEHIVSSQGEVLYQEAGPQQLLLFDRMTEYLTNKRVRGGQR